MCLADKQGHRPENTALDVRHSRSQDVDLSSAHADVNPLFAESAAPREGCGSPEWSFGVSFD